MQKKLGVEGNGGMLSTLLYADNIVLVAQCEKNLQGLIDMVASWYARWEMELNLSKTKVIHFRRKLKSKPRSTFSFNFNRNIQRNISIWVCYLINISTGAPRCRR